MAECFCAELILKKGPETLQRRISLRIPKDGTPVTVGRAPENDIVLDANLVFASQRHCQLFVRPVMVTTSDEDAVKEERKEEKEAIKSRRQKRLRAGRDALQLELCLVDMGSSNGTFVNGVRVEVNAVTPLRRCDMLVLGGMRDIAVGASLPVDVVTFAPEIVTWCVALNEGEVNLDYVAPPPVVLCADFVEAEEKRMALELLQRMTSPPPASHGFTTAVTPPPTVLKRWNEAQSGQEKEEEHNKTPQTPAAREVVLRDHADNNNSENNEAANAQDETSASTRRSGTVAAEILVHGDTMGNATHLFVILRAVRVGMHNFFLSRAKNAARKGGRLRIGDTRKKGNQLSHLYTLTLTETHWKWVMNNAVGSYTGRGGKVTNVKQQSIIEYQLPWSYVERIMYCEPQYGLTVQLLLPDVKNLLPPLAKLSVDSAERPIHVTWMVDPAKDRNKDNIETVGSAPVTFQQFLGKLRRICARNKAPEPQPLEESEFLDRYAPDL
ncbi:kinetoplastid kinetochore protein 13 [Trypanosoma cruzi]|uniref:Kinetoplastid kinetochore protein 13 n=1 Tax=Trypanosoma cruzi TaxID=5693 RepID=A0A7J6XY36_TRYCR|nr:kinetoplastid kinetochore protein 13 [Trypanosoma cruzi]